MGSSRAEDVRSAPKPAAPSLPRMFGTYTLAVLGEMNSLLATPLDYGGHAIALDRNEVGALLVAARLKKSCTAAEAVATQQPSCRACSTAALWATPSPQDECLR
jgi:hypothetical protein